MYNPPVLLSACWINLYYDFNFYYYYKMISNSRLTIGDQKYEQVKEFLHNNGLSNTGNYLEKNPKSRGMQQFTKFLNRQKDVPYTKIFNDMLPFEENTYTKKEFLETYFKHATDHTLLPFLKRLSNSESYSRKEVKKEFKITIPADTNYLIVVNPYNITSAVTIYNANNSQLSFVTSLSLADRFQQYYSSHLFRLGYCCATNISKRESSTDNKIIMDTGLIGGNVPLELMDNIIQNASTKITHAQLTYDAFDPIYTTLFNSSNNVYYTTDPINPIEDSVSYLINTTTPTPLNSLDAVNLPGDSVMISNIGNNDISLNLYTIVNNTPTSISGTYLYANNVYKITPSGSAVYAGLSSPGTVELKTSKKSARSQDLIYYKVYAPNSPAILNISFRAVYDVAVSGTIRTEIGTFMEDDVEDEFASLLMEHIYKHSGIHNFPDNDVINLQAGFFSDIVSKLLNKIPYIGSYLSKGFNFLDNELKLDARDDKKIKYLEACCECPSNNALQSILHSPNNINAIYMILDDVSDSISYPSAQILDTLRSYINDDTVKRIYEIYKLKLTSNNTKILLVEFLSDDFKNIYGPIYMDHDKNVLALAIKITSEKKFLKGNVWLGDSNVRFDGIYVNFFKESNFPKIITIFFDELKTLRRHKAKKNKLKTNDDNPHDFIFIDGKWRIIRPNSFPGAIHVPIEWKSLISYWPGFYINQIVDKDDLLIKNIDQQLEESIILNDNSNKDRVINLYAMDSLTQPQIYNSKKSRSKPHRSENIPNDDRIEIRVNDVVDNNDQNNNKRAIKSKYYRKFRHQKMTFSNSNTYTTPYLNLHNKLRQHDIYIGLDNSQKKQRSLSQLTTPTLDDESYGVRYQFFPVLAENQEDDSLACMVLSDRDLEATYNEIYQDDIQVFIDEQIATEYHNEIVAMIFTLYYLGVSIEAAYADKPIYITIFTKFNENVKIAYTSYMPALVACMVGAPNGQIMTGHIKENGQFSTISQDYLQRKMEILRVKQDLVGKMILAVEWNEDLMDSFGSKYPLTSSSALAIDGPSSNTPVLQISSIEQFILFCRLPMQSKGFTTQLLKALGLLSPLHDDIDKLRVAIHLMGRYVKKGNTRPELDMIASIYKVEPIDRNALITLPNGDTVTVRITGSYRKDADSTLARTNTNTGFTMEAVFGTKTARYVINAEKIHLLLQAYIKQANDKKISIIDQIQQLERATFSIGDRWVTDGVTFAVVYEYFKHIESKYFPQEYQAFVSDRSDNKDSLIKFATPIDNTQTDDFTKALDTTSDVDLLCALFKKLAQLLYPDMLASGLRTLHNVNQAEVQIGTAKVALLTKK